MVPTMLGDMAWYIPVLVFVARIGDVSIGTIRTIFVISGWKWRATALGFVEVIIWALAIAGLITEITNPIMLVSYAGGYAAGNLVGISIENRLAYGVRIVQFMNRDVHRNLSREVRELGYRVTRVQGEGRDGAVEMGYVVVKRRNLRELLRELDEMSPNMVVTVERAEHASSMALGHRLAARSNPLRWMGEVRK